MSDLMQDKENMHTMKSPKSPNILKPKQLCFKRKHRGPTAALNPLGSVNCNIPESVRAENGFLSKNILPINPFKCMDNKRKRQENIEEHNESVGKMPKHDKNEIMYQTVVPSYLNEDAQLGYHSHFSNIKEANALKQKLETIPVDWSLKTKIQLTSSKPFPWRSSFRTSELASGTTAFVRCLHVEDQQRCNLDSSHGAKFYQQCLIWIHPSMPWLNLFPRIASQEITNSPLPSLDKKWTESLYSSWCDSFLSLYQLVQTRQCPYFYVCAPAFTVMFRSAGVGSISEIHAAITPTTERFREALSQEDISFMMPLKTKSKQDNLDDCTQTQPQENLNDCAEDSGEEEPETWLESLGLSQQDFPSLNSVNVKREKGRRRKADRTESLVYVDGPDAQGLRNFLVNHFSSIAGIPPTLLSPVAFLGATLQSHKVQHAKIRKKDAELHVVELKGPILPNTVHSLCSLLSSTQEGNFSVTLTPHQPTLPFAKLPYDASSAPSIFATENLKDCGLAKSFIKHMCTKHEADASSGLTSIVAENGLFSCS